ncbi:c-type cytochrome [Halomonas alkaliantarctica]|nr:c-type cytochrome [Halomonas alkaliantarctica]
MEPRAEKCRGERHRHAMRLGIKAAYADKSSPLNRTPQVLETGGQLYMTHCASCHGESGRGDGPVANSLDTQPTNIAAFSRMPLASDAYLYWTLAEGGNPLDSAMPAFQDVLKEK